MKDKRKYTPLPTIHQRRGGKRRRRLDVDLPLAETLKVEQDPDAWVDSLTDDEIADIIGPSWAELTGRRVEDLEIEWTDEGAGHAA